MSPVFVWWLAAAVVALQIPYPLVHGHARNVLSIATVIVFAAASVAHGLVTGGRARAAALLAVGVVGFAAEVLGVHTGVPFGDYHYTGGLGPTLASVPVVIALAWLMMAQPAACVAARLTRHRWRRVLIATVALAAWDVFLDPQMVDAHHWRWTHPHPHLPGVGDVPLSNYGGWLLVSLVVMLLTATFRVFPAAGKTTNVAVNGGFTTHRGDGPMLMLWIWTWLSSTFANLAFFHRPAVALWGFLVMGTVGIPLVRDVTR